VTECPEHRTFSLEFHPTCLETMEYKQDRRSLRDIIQRSLNIKISAESEVSAQTSR